MFRPLVAQPPLSEDEHLACNSLREVEESVILSLIAEANAPQCIEPPAEDANLHASER
jgi:hypothetical protein